MSHFFIDRKAAGVQLAQALKAYRGKEVIVLALPRGGIVLGFEVAKALEAPLGLVITRKIGHPMSPEWAVCAVAEDGTLLCDEAERVQLDPEWLRVAVKNEQAEAARRRHTYLPKDKDVSLKGKVVIVVDDGVATGLTLRVALKALTKQQPKKLVVAVPVSPHSVVETLKQEADEVVVLEDALNYLGAVGTYYDKFPQVSDREVIDLLKRSAKSLKKRNQNN